MKEYIVIGLLVVFGIVVAGLSLDNFAKRGQINTLHEEVAKLQAQATVLSSSNESLSMLVDECNVAVDEFKLESDERIQLSEVALAQANREIAALRKKFDFLQRDLSAVPESKVCQETDDLVRKYLGERNVR